MSRRPRNEELDFDDGKGAAQTLKIVGLGLGSLVCVGLIFGGFLFLSSRKTEMANLPSVQGMIMQVGSKGRITAREFDETIGNVCHTMAVMSQVSMPRPPVVAI